MKRRSRATLAVAAGSTLTILIAARGVRADNETPTTPPSTPTAPSEDAGAEAAPTAEGAESATTDSTPAPKHNDVESHVSFDIGAYQDTVAVSVLTPSLGARVEDPAAGWGINGRYLVDVVSAASPDIVTTASPHWTEIRHAGNLGGRYKPGNFGIGLGVVTSYTPDYLALGANAQLTQDLDEKNLTLVGGYGYGHDVIGRTGTPFSVFSHQLDYHSINLGVSRVVNPALVLGLFGDLILERGDQSKPYRYIPIFSPTDAPNVARGASVDSVAAMRIQARPLEQLPLERERLAVTGRVAWRLTSSTIRVEERFYGDTWGMRASTTDARWLFDLSDRFTLWPHVRFHVQNGVEFWQRAYSATSVHDLPALRTGDRELAPLMNIGLGVGLRFALGKPGSEHDSWVSRSVLTTTLDGVHTSFTDTIYVKERGSGLFVTGLEVGF